MTAEQNEANRSAAERTARFAMLAGTPGLALTAVAALSSNSLALQADLVLTALDMLVVITVWAIAFSDRRGVRPKGRMGLARAKQIACTLAAICMLFSMCVVSWTALQRIGDGGLAPHGSGVVIGLTINGAYALVNAWILRGWRSRYRDEPSAFVRSQVCLFWDKLSTNLIVAASLGAALCFPDAAIALYTDPLAGLLIAAATARWVAPVLRDSLRAAWIDQAKRRRRIAQVRAG